MKKVMLVDDDEGVVYTAARMLKTEGLEVIPALSGEECLRKLKAIKPDCIILDIMMPDMDGWVVLKKIKEDKALASIPVLILTAKPASMDALRGIGTKGYADYLMKPFTKDELLKSLGKVGILPRWTAGRY